MKYATIKTVDIANGTGVRVSLFVSGCTHRCPECFNEIAWDFNYGQEFNQETIDLILKALEPSHIAGLTLLGGEPMELVNQEGLLPLLQQVRKCILIKIFGVIQAIFMKICYQVARCMDLTVMKY